MSHASEVLPRGMQPGSCLTWGRRHWGPRDPEQEEALGSNGEQPLEGTWRDPQNFKRGLVQDGRHCDKPWAALKAMGGPSA